MGGIWTPGAPWGPKRQKRPIIPICLWHMLFCSAARATKKQTHERLKAPGSAYLSERGGGLQQSSPSNTASAKAEAQRLMQPALHPVMQAASCRLHTQLTSIFYWAKNHHAHACASYRQVCQNALPLRSSPDRSKTLCDHLL